MIKNTVFDEIIKKNIKAKIIYEDKLVTAFYDIYPKAPVHIIVIPNIKIINMNYLNIKHKKILGKMLLVCAKIAKILKIDKSGYRLVINCNKDSGQEIDYLHIHILGGKNLGNMVN